MGSLIDAAVDDALLFVKAESESIMQAKAISDEVSRTEISRLQAQNTLLSRALEAEKSRSEKAKEELLQRMSGLLDDFVATRHQELSDAFGTVLKGNLRAEEELGKFGQQHERLIDHAHSRGAELSASFARKGAEGKRLRDGAMKVVLPLIVSDVSEYFPSLRVQPRIRSRKDFQLYNYHLPRQQQHILENFRDIVRRFKRRSQVVLIVIIEQRELASRLRMQ